MIIGTPELVSWLPLALLGPTTKGTEMTLTEEAFRISGAAVLSATTMLADKPHPSMDELACGELASLCFDDLASGYRTHGWATRAAGYRAAI